MAEMKTPPGPGLGAAYSNVRAFLRNRAEFMVNLQERYGDIARFRLGIFDVYFVNEPDYVKEVFMNDKDFRKSTATKFLKILLGNGLLLSEGDYHRRQRKLIQPAFHPKRIRTYCQAMIDFASRMSEEWSDGQEVDMHEEMMRLTMEITAKTLFNTNIEGVVAQVKKSVDTIMPTVDRIAQPTGFIKMLLPLPSTIGLYRERHKLNRLIYRIIEEGRQSGEDRGDLLSTLLMAQDEEGDGEGMTDRQIRDEVMTLFLAGHETTAVALTWTWYLLAQHPEATDRLNEELHSVLGGRLPDTEDVGRLPYTRMVLSESMRLYPPAYLTDRMTTKSWRVGDFEIPAGKYVFLCPYTMHRHPEYFPQPERFDPDRWTPEKIAERPKFSYFPFGGGARVCIGEQFAWMEMVLVIATIAQKWKPTLANDRPVETQALITLRPKDGVRMVLHRR